MFRPNTLYYSDGYKVGHKRMLAPGIDYLYGTFIPRSGRRAPKGITKVVSAGQQLTVKWLHDEFKENFFKLKRGKAMKFAKDMSLYLGMKFDGSHFKKLHKLGYLPIQIKSLPEGIETDFGIPHMTFINTVKGYAWLTLYLETIISSLYWKTSTAATTALQYRRTAEKWVKKTDPANQAFAQFMCHDFSARGLDPFSMLACGLGHAFSNSGSDTLLVIPGSRYFYNVPEDEVCIASVNASEHSVSTTKIFTVGEKQMLIDWLIEFPTGILSIVADTFDLWKLITEYLTDPEVKKLIEERGARGGKLVIRPDSGDPVDITCGKVISYRGQNGDKYLHDLNNDVNNPEWEEVPEVEAKGVVELLWDIFGGDTNEQGYKRLNPCIGVIYGDAITLERQELIYTRLEAKGFAATNIVLGIGSFTYQYVTRDTFGFAVKGAWFEIEGVSYDIYKDPITDRGDKKSLKGMCQVYNEVDEKATFSYYLNEYANMNSLKVLTECTKEEESKGLLLPIYKDGEFSNQTSLKQIRNNLYFG